MAEVNNTIAIDFKVDTTALKAIKSQLDVFKNSLSGMSAPEMFDISGSINNNISALQAQIATNNEMFSSLKNMSSEEQKLNQITRGDKSAAMKELSLETDSLSLRLRTAKDSASILQQQLNLFGGTRANFEFINGAAEKLGYTFNAVAKQMQQLSLVAQANGTVMNKATGAIITQAKALGILKSSMYKFNMNILSVMFAMMALNRYLMGFARSAITTYQKANDESTQLGKATWELQAAWEFLKYSLVDALTQSQIFNWLVGVLLWLVNLFNRMDPGVKAFIAIAIAVAIVVTGVTLLYTQLQPLLALIGSKAAFTGGLAKMGILLLGLILIVAGLALVIYGVTKLIKDWGTGWKNVTNDIIMILIGLSLFVAGISVLMGSWLVAGFAIGFALILAGVYWVIDGFKKSWEDGIQRLLGLIYGLVTAFMVAMIAILLIGTAPAWLIVAAWILGIAAVVAIIAAAVLVIIKYWNQILIFFNKVIIAIVQAIRIFYLTVIEIWQFLITGIIEFIFLIPTAFVKVYEFIIDKAISFVQRLLSIFKNLPGIGGLVSAATKGLEKLKKIDFGGGLDSIKEGTIGIVTSIADGASKVVNKMADAAQNWGKENIDAINKQIKAKEEENRIAQEAAKNEAKAAQNPPEASTKEKLTGALKNFVGGGTLDKVGTATQPVQNVTNIQDNKQITNTFNLPEGMTDPEEIYKYISERQSDDLNRYVDSSNN